MTTATASHLRLPGFFSDHMVLQRETDVPVWGWAPPGATVSLSFAGQSLSAKADATGKWMARLKPLPAGGPHELAVSSGDQKLALKDVLVGDVYLCSGQSNMEWPVSQTNNADGVMAQAGSAPIRHVMIPHVTHIDPQTDVTAEWTVCSSRTIGSWTGVGYYFADRIQKKYNIPIGLLHSSWGGSNCQTWCSREALSAEPALRYFVEMLSPEAQVKIKEEIKKQAELFEERCTHKDPGNAGFTKGWANVDCDTRDWKTMDVPRAWETLPGMNIDGSVWFRKTVEIPAAMAGKELSLKIGAADDFDTTYFNGIKIGATGQETPNWWAAQRDYTVPGHLVKAGKATIAVRVFDRMGAGGLVGGGPMSLSLPGKSEGAVRLEGDWLYKIELALEPKPIDGWVETPGLPGQMNSPCALSNAMIEPLLPFALKGVLWYQGESNAGKAYEYRHLFRTMIRDWRKRFGQSLPFFVVQLANFLPRDRQPQESSWAELREAQHLALGEPNTALAVSIDVGDALDIHPRDKQTVGVRLALAAEHLFYGSKEVFSGPVYESIQIEGDTVRLRFKHVGAGLVNMGGVLTAFSIAGADKRFVWANAHIEGDTVLVSSPDVAKPASVRYGWANNPPCNLYNAEGLPAVPFRTDDWPMVTGGPQ